MRSTPRLEWSGLRFLREAHADGVESTVDIQYFARDARSEIGAQKGCRVPHVLGRYIPAQRRDFGNLIQHLAEAGDTRRRERLYRSCRDAKDARAHRAQVRCK